MIEHREYQVRLINDAMKAFDDGCKNVLIVSPCGSGKTLVSLQLLRQMQQKRKLRIGWVAMRHKLLQQAELENQRVGVKDITFLSMFEKHPPKCDVMVCDEGHHDSATSCALLHKRMKVEISLGLSGTPFRTDRVKLAFDKIISDYGVRFLIEKGYLCNFDQYVVPEFSPKVVADRLISEPERWGKSVVYMPTEAACQETDALLKRRGVASETIFGWHSHQQRDEIFTRFEQGQTQVLINIYLLSEGFDCPDLRSVFVRDANKLCTIQMSGRSLRKDPSDPTKTANIIQSEKAPFPYTRVTKARQQWHWLNSWHSVSHNERAEAAVKQALKMIATTKVTLPEYLLKKRAKEMRNSVLDP